MKSLKIWLILFFLLVHGKNYACECVGNTTIGKEVRYTNVIFSGKLVEKKLLFWADSLKLRNIPFVGNARKLKKVKNYYNNYIIKKYEYTFEVGKVYKGKLIREKIHVISGLGEEDCGFIFDVGKTYIVFAHKFSRPNINTGKTEKYLETDTCTRTALYNEDLNNYLVSQ